MYVMLAGKSSAVAATADWQRSTTAARGGFICVTKFTALHQIAHILSLTYSIVDVVVVVAIVVVVVVFGVEVVVVVER